MIRERRAEDLDRLCTILKSMNYPSGSVSGKDVKGWLEEHAAEQFWVFDMAPVTVAPTKNVVGHVQIYGPSEDLLNDLRRPAGELLVIGKLFVRPDTHEYGIARYLLKQAVNHIQRQGKLPVLDRAERWAPAHGFYEKFGFSEVTPEHHEVDPMIYTR